MSRLFNQCVMLGAIVAILLVGGCATAPDTPNHQFSFDATNESPEIEILGYQYGNSKLPGVRDDVTTSEFRTGHIGQATGVHGPMLRGEFLYVRWRIRSTGKVYEDRVDLRHRLPANLTDYQIHFVVKREQLYVYLISPEKVTGLCPRSYEAAQKEVQTRDSHNRIFSMYCDLKITLIYPDQHDTNSPTGVAQ